MSTQPATENLVKETKRYLTVEKSVLEEMIESLEQLRSAILQRDLDSVYRLSEQLDQQRVRRDQLAKQRNAIRESIAEMRRLPQEKATLSRLIVSLPPQDQTVLRELSSSVRTLALKANQMNRMNLSVVSHFAQLTQSMIESLTGKTIVNRYGRSGQIDTNPSAPIFQTDY